MVVKSALLNTETAAIFMSQSKLGYEILNSAGKMTFLSQRKTPMITRKQNSFVLKLL